jgi:hypothetical protein
VSLRSILLLRSLALSVALAGAVAGYYEGFCNHRLDIAFGGFALWAFGCGSNVRLRTAMYEKLDA